MSPEALRAPSPSVPLFAGDGKTASSELKRHFPLMRKVIAGSYPDDDAEAWRWRTEEGERRIITPPTNDPQEWLDTRVSGSDKFSRRLAQRYVTLWRDLEKRGFTANNKKLFEHQKALFAWLTISGVCSGSREACSALIRSPYGTGKTLVEGLAMEGFQDLLLELMFVDKIKRDKLPRAALIGHRKELLLQNALGGDQFVALRPPYTVDTAHMREYHKQLTTMFGAKFAEFFPAPKGQGSAWYAMFGTDEEEGEEETETDGNRRIGDFLVKRGKHALDGFNEWKERDAVYDVLGALIEGRIILLPDVRNIPHVREAPPRIADLGAAFRGDAAYALHPDLGIKATHKHLLPDPSRYRNKEDPAHPDLMLLAHGNAVSRDPDRIRQDIRSEIMPYLALIGLDEAGKLNPYAVGDTTFSINGRHPNIIGCTGNDSGIEGWKERSPAFDEQETITLGLTKPVGFQLIGSEDTCFPQGSEGAWKQYRDVMFRDVQAAKTLGIPQPHECDTLVVAPPNEVREFAFRIEEEHRKAGREVEVYCFDGAAGQDRWKVIEQRMKAPKAKGDPRRIVVAPLAMLSTGVSIPIDCIDVLASVRQSYEIDQLLGRLYHRRAVDGKAGRTYFRQQVLTGGGEIKLRSVAEKLGFPLPEQDAEWIPLHCAIDRTAKERDDRRQKMGAPEPVPDVRQPKRPEGKGRDWQSVNDHPSSSLVLEKQKQKRLRALQDILPTKSPEMIAALVSSKTLKAEGTTNGGRAIVVNLPLQENGLPSGDAIEAVAKEFGISSFWASISSDLAKAHQDGARGGKLVKVALQTVLRLVNKQEERSKNGNH